MRDYYVFSLSDIHGPISKYGLILHVDDVPWASRQMWAPDAVLNKGTFYPYFPAKDYADIFRIGVARSNSPTGPFIAENNPVIGSYNIDPAVPRRSARLSIRFDNRR